MGKLRKRNDCGPATCEPTLPAITQVKSEEEDQQNMLVTSTVQRVLCENLGQGVILSLLFGELARRSPVSRQHRPKLDVERERVKSRPTSSGSAKPKTTREGKTLLDALPSYLVATC